MELLPLFRHILTKQDIQNSHKLGELIEYSSHTALKFLNSKYQLDRTKFLNLGYTFADIAVEAIIPLFTQNKSACEPGIIKSLKDWESPIETEEQAQFFLNKVVVTRVNQELIRIYKEADPFFAKIHDSVEYVIDKYGYRKKVCFGTVFIVRDDIESLGKKFISSEEFDSLPSFLFIGKFEKVISALLVHLSDSNFIPAIPLNLFIKRLKHIQLSSYESKNILEAETSEIIDSEKILNESLLITYSKLDSTYCSKLSEEDRKIFRSILIDISEDLKNGGLSSGLYEYLHVRKQNISKEDFYKRYHSILDYLVRLLKKEIAERIKYD